MRVRRGLAAGVLIAASGLFACAVSDHATAQADSQAADTTAFDARSWMAQAAPIWDSSAWGDDYEGTKALSKAAAWALNGGAPWLDTCREWWEDAEYADDETGMMRRYDLGDNRYLIEVTCSFGAYQGQFSLILVDDDQATLLRIPTISMNGDVIQSDATIRSGMTYPDVVRDGAISIFERSRGIGGCGILVTYQLEESWLEPVLARAQSCDVDCDTETCIDPATWPIIYSSY